MMRVVAFPMYIMPEVRVSMGTFWQKVKARLGMDDLPDMPSFENPLEHSADIFLTQFCSYPYLKFWQEKRAITPLASFHYDFAHCAGMNHRSVIIVNRDASYQTLADLRGKKVVINEATSNTGMNLLRREVAELADGKPFFASVTPTGSSVNNMNALVRGEADVASVDAVTFGYANLHLPEVTAKLRVIGQTRDCPSLPLFVPSAMDLQTREHIVQAFADVIAAERDLVQGKLKIKGISKVDDAALEISRDYEREAVKLGYPELV